MPHHWFKKNDYVKTNNFWNVIETGVELSKVDPNTLHCCNLVSSVQAENNYPSSKSVSVIFISSQNNWKIKSRSFNFS